MNKKIASDNKKNEKIKKQDPVNDDYQVVLDDRGFYRVGEKWFVKIRRINVREMISLWGIISSIFPNLTSLGVDLNDPKSWLIMFMTALPIVPGKFYQFLAQVMELQFDETLPIEKTGKMRDEYNKYLREDLKTEELFDIVNTIYEQEKDRFEELIKKAQSLFSPLIKSLTDK